MLEMSLEKGFVGAGQPHDSAHDVCINDGMRSHSPRLAQMAHDTVGSSCPQWHGVLEYSCGSAGIARTK